MPDYATLADLNTYTGQTVDSTLGQMLLDSATDAVDDYCLRTFQLKRRVEMQYGNNGNILMLRNYPVQQVNNVRIIMPGSLAFNIPVSQLLVQPEIGKIVNFTPLMFQMYGYTAVFPLDIPIQIDYSYGPYDTVYDDIGTPDAAYQVYTFTNQNWFSAAVTSVYKNGSLLHVNTDYTVDYVNGKVTLTNPATSSDKVTADYWFYSVPQSIKLATLMIAAKQLNLPKNASEMKSSESDTDYKVEYNLAGALSSIDAEIAQLLKRYRRKGAL